MNELSNENVTNWLGTTRVPLGEISIYDFVSGKYEEHELSRAEVQIRFTAIQRQIAVYISLSAIFMHNFYVIVNILRSQPKNISVWCCLFVALLGSGYVIPISMLALVNSMSCRQICWYGIITVCLSAIFNGIILLHKAYLASLRRLWVAVIGMIFVLLQVGFMVVAIVITPVTIDPQYACAVEYSSLMMYAWIGTVLPVNVFFSAIFSYVTYTQYKTFGSDAWRRLAEDGIQTMCLVLLCNVICGCFIAFRAFGSGSDIFFIIDW
ncbi:hypothetical protein BDF19DRAFT_324501 [Syncephalis fuscata]|nr:hypothetical protein BDF19DRAFT_324501 [Syncephalis fuscata]